MVSRKIESKLDDVKKNCKQHHCNKLKHNNLKFTTLIIIAAPTQTVCMGLASILNHPTIESDIKGKPKFLLPGVLYVAFPVTAILMTKFLKAFYLSKSSANASLLVATLVSL